jgi:hypothetical protein
MTWCTARRAGKRIERGRGRLKKRKTDLHVMHILSDFVPILLFKKNALSAEGLYLSFALSLLEEQRLGRARRATERRFGGEQGRFAKLDDTMGGRAFLGIGRQSA